MPTPPAPPPRPPTTLRLVHSDPAARASGPGRPEIVTHSAWTIRVLDIDIEVGELGWSPESPELVIVGPLPAGAKDALPLHAVRADGRQVEVYELLSVLNQLVIQAARHLNRERFETERESQVAYESSAIVEALVYRAFRGVARAGDAS